MVVRSLVAAAAAAAGHAAALHVAAEGLHATLRGILAHVLALKNHPTVIKPPASSSGLEKTNVMSQVHYIFHGLFGVPTVPVSPVPSFLC